MPSLLLKKGPETQTEWTAYTGVKPQRVRLKIIERKKGKENAEISYPTPVYRGTTQKGGAYTVQYEHPEPLSLTGGGEKKRI